MPSRLLSPFRWLQGMAARLSRPAKRARDLTWLLPLRLVPASIHPGASGVATRQTPAASHA